VVRESKEGLVKGINGEAFAAIFALEEGRMRHREERI
jgi:hypothetical protein